MIDELGELLPDGDFVQLIHLLLEFEREENSFRLA